MAWAEMLCPDSSPTIALTVRVFGCVYITVPYAFWRKFSLLQVSLKQHIAKPHLLRHLVNMWGAGCKGKGFGGKDSWGKGSWASPFQSLWGFGKGKGFGKDKGKGKYTCSPDKKVWVGGLTAPEPGASRDFNKGLQEHLKQAGDCKHVSIGKSGSGGAAFATAEEALNCIATLNGSVYNGMVIEIDTWTLKDGSAFEPRTGKGKGKW